MKKNAFRNRKRPKRRRHPSICQTHAVRLTWPEASLRYLEKPIPCLVTFIEDVPQFINLAG